MLALLSLSPVGFATLPTTNTSIAALPNRMTYTGSGASNVGTAQNHEYVLIARNKECGSSDARLGTTTTTVAECASLCRAHAQCRSFVHGKAGTSAAGYCYWEHTTDSCDTEGLETDDNYDFYSLGGRECTCATGYTGTVSWGSNGQPTGCTRT